MDIKKILPNILTIANLTVGFAAILLISGEYYSTAVSFVIIAMVLDGLDGKVARKFQVSGDFGTELDSLCDVVSFGVVPGYFMWANNSETSPLITTLFTITALLFLICGAYRLARFNVETTSGEDFTGIPITIAGGILVLGSFYIAPFSAILVIMLAVILSLLMISEVPYPSFKGVTLPNEYWWYLIFLGIIILFILFPLLFLFLLSIYFISGFVKLII
ncbi:CDP-diacylglycerol--serine O-phosphatidyltransferase [Natranaerobius thermophilus]|uniref:CDP-diacylglycerol--serine O-phosphatidyltransferase n=1 Tax=Natranaerobius thermophilus (strain ATCC BAA-1301 / DSM 18059 / JW/NM-WN-LF) TaxID=457570 RepID=B2A4A5_NATTJ|nr:CDP-diacylglycerol--serine O-phosphatidyltransferase [Natranaerobius thermophilus]ACB83759.1 CDP-diacylglycerol--serine O-phosphatidyltransferase [Natranaerobius thermophilus JW/NM-WN-LF]